MPYPMHIVKWVWEIGAKNRSAEKAGRQQVALKQASKQATRLRSSFPFKDFLGNNAVQHLVIKTGVGDIPSL